MTAPLWKNRASEAKECREAEAKLAELERQRGDFPAASAELAWISTEPDLPNMPVGQPPIFESFRSAIIMRNGALIVQLPSVSWHSGLTIQANSEAFSTKRC